MSALTKILKPPTRSLKRVAIAAAFVTALGFASLGSPAEADARGCRGGFGPAAYGYGGGFGPGYYGAGYRGFYGAGYRGVGGPSFYRAGYRGFGPAYYGGRRGVSVAIGF